MDPFVNPSVQQDSTTDELDESMIYPTYRKRSSEASFMGPSCFRAKDLAPGGSCQTPHPQTAMFLGGPSMVCHPAIDVSKEAFEDHSDSLYLDDSKVSLSSNFSLYSVQNESSNVELRPASPMESDCWRTMSSYVEAQIENTIQWVENYTYSPELIDTVTLPLEDCMCTDEPTATMTAPVEYHAYNHELRNSVTPPSATYRHSFEAIHYMTPAVADHIHTAQYLHPTMPPTGKPSKLSKKRPAIEPPSPSPSTSSRKLRLLELSPLRLHPSTRKTGWVRSPKPTSLGFTDFGLTITNPLVLYRALLATKRIDPDPAQHRLALHLQKLYYRLKDYEPEVDFSHQLRQLNLIVRKSPPALEYQCDGVQRTQDKRHGYFSVLRGQKEKADAMALTRILTSHESAIHLQSPQGLLLYGEVGTGKSLLVDLLADCLPSRKKRRWHFNTFMLEIFARLEQLRRSRLTTSSNVAAGEGLIEEHSLLWLARDMISTSPILFLDEFQLPDRTASKILSNLLTSFFHLGGVLIATSNRMPEELANASGIEFAAPPASRLGLLGSRWGLLGNSQNQGGRSGKTLVGKGDFTAFLDVLKARCEVWDMEGGRDWRRREAEEESVVQEQSEEMTMDDTTAGFEGLEPLAFGNWGLGYEQSLHVKPVNEESRKRTLSKSFSPKHFFVRPSSIAQKKLEQTESAWKTLELISVYGLASTPSSDTETSWESTTVRVYGRDLLVPRQLSGVTKWTFHELCSTNLGPADYITLASSFHTFILTEVPILTLHQKNDARRLITLLDALYEARCKLLISAEAGPDEIFFPETQGFYISDETVATSDDGVYSETLSEIYQDQTSPFRPNISSYTSSASPPSYASSPLPASLSSQAASARSILADEDSDFGPVYGAGRSSGPSTDAVGAGNGISRQSGPDFTQTGTFTGEDERFAYKRARSRLWEMCGSRWWAREEEGWWRPVGKDVRRWEGVATAAVPPSPPNEVSNDERTGRRGDELFKHGASPFRTSQEPPPKFGFQHAWGMMRWGRKAGAWGKGPEGLDERKKKGE